MTDIEPDAVAPAAEETGTTERSGAPRWVVWAMIVLATVIAIFSSLNAWVEQQVLETENWVEVSDELLANDEIRGALSQYIADELFEGVDIADQIDSQLPDALVGLGGFVAPAIRAGAPQAIDRVLGSDASAGLWRQVNETAHQAFVAVARGDDSAIQSNDGVVVLDLGEFVRMLGIDLGLEERLGDRLPDDAGQLVLFESDIIDQIQSAVRIIELTSVILFVVVVGLYVGAVYLARDWRRQALRGVGVCIVVGGLAVLLLRNAAVSYATNQVADQPSVRDAVRAVGVIATDLLDEIAWTAIVVGLVIALYAVLIGPSRAATTIRRWLRPVAAQPLAFWAIGVALLLLYMFGAPVAPRQWLSTLVVAVLWVAGIEMLRRAALSTPDETADDDGDDSADEPDQAALSAAP
ncbi:MAG: hypothetical protein HRT86_04195 [Ilumatobacteraceae bacterium]|nr:hypothetical protein [Ilumatobacteraceae bacterium]